MKNRRELELFFEHRRILFVKKRNMGLNNNFILVYMKFDILNKTLINYAFNTFTIYLLFT